MFEIMDTKSLCPVYHGRKVLFKKKHWHFHNRKMWASSSPGWTLYLLEETGTLTKVWAGEMAQLGRACHTSTRDPSSNLRSPCNKPGMGGMFIVLVLGRQKWVDPCGLLASYFSLPGELQAHERDRLKEGK